MIFGGDAQALSVAGAEGGGGGVEIVQRIDIGPEFRHGDDQVGMTEPHRRQLPQLVVPIGDFLAHQIRAGHPQMNAPGGQFARDFTGGQQHQLDAFDAFDRARIFAVRAGAAQTDTAFGEPIKGFLHQPPFGRHTQFQGHCAASVRVSNSAGRITPPTAGIERPCPSTRVSAS